MKKVFYLFILLLSVKSFAQIGPPPPSYPTENNKVLIDKLVETADFKNYIKNYIFDRVNLASRIEKWDENKKTEILKSYRNERLDDAIYNAFSNYSTEELQSLIDIFKKINPKRKSNLLPMPFILQIRMEGYAKSLINGDFLYLNEKK